MRCNAMKNPSGVADCFSAAFCLRAFTEDMMRTGKVRRFDGN